MSTFITNLETIVDPNAVLREIQKRNHFVFKKLFEDLYEELVKYANGYLFDTSSSKDVVQEVFVKLWEKSDRIEIRTTLKAYLYAMVRNRCLNVLKAIKITDAANIFELQATIIDTEYSFGPAGNEDRDKVHKEALKMVDALPTKMQKIVKLRFINNYRYSEIADEMGISVNTVKTQLTRAKAKFGKPTIFIIALLSLLK